MIAQSIRQFQPNRLEIHLPFLSFEELYHRVHNIIQNYTNGNKNAPSSIPSKSYLHRLFKTYTPNLKLRKSMRFPKCGTCEELQQIFFRFPYCAANLEYRNRYLTHIIHMKNQHQGYMNRPEMERNNTTDLLSLVIDGADRSANSLPRFVQWSKSLRVEGFKIKLAGVKRHTSPHNQVLCYLMTEEIQTGANHIVETLYRALQRTKDRSSVTLP